MNIGEIEKNDFDILNTRLDLIEICFFIDSGMRDLMVLNAIEDPTKSDLETIVGLSEAIERALSDRGEKVARLQELRGVHPEEESTTYVYEYTPPEEAEEEDA